MSTLWNRIKKAIADYGPMVIKFIIDCIVGAAIFIQKQFIYALQQIFGR